MKLKGASLSDIQLHAAALSAYRREVEATADAVARLRAEVAALDGQMRATWEAVEAQARERGEA